MSGCAPNVPAGAKRATIGVAVLIGIMALIGIGFVRAIPARATPLQTPDPTDPAGGTTTLLPSFEDEGIRITRGIQTANMGGFVLTVDVYQPSEAATGRPAVVLIHGGAWFQGSPADMEPQGRLIAEQGWVAFAINYRLATREAGSWPQALSDVQRQIRWVGANAATFGADRERIALIGSSAGGQLASLIASVGTVDLAALAGEAAPDDNPPIKPAAVVAWSAPLELAPLAGIDNQPPETCGTNEYCREFWKFPFTQTFLGCDPAACPESYTQASPVTWVSEETSPMWIANSTHEIVPVGQLQLMASQLEQAGVVHSIDILEGNGHGTEYTDLVWNDMTPWLADQLGVPLPNPIQFPARGGGFSSQLALTVTSLAVLLALLFASVFLTTRRTAGQGTPATT